MNNYNKEITNKWGHTNTFKEYYYRMKEWISIKYE